MSSNAQIMPIKERAATVQQLLLQNKSAIQNILPKHLTIDRMLKVINLIIRRTPKLLECTPQSLLAAVMEAASLGLEPGVLGQAYFVPFRNTKAGGRLEVQLIPGYKGLIQLCRNTGELSTITAQAVYQNDKFEASFGTDPRIVHVPTEDEKPGPLRAAYAVARLKDGSIQFDVMFRRDIEKIRRRSRSAESGPWVTDFEEMSKKTVMRRLAKYLPASTEKMQRLVELDEQAEAGLAQELEVIPLPVEETPELNGDGMQPPPTRTPSKLDQVVANARKPRSKPAEPEYVDAGGGFAEGSDPDPFLEREPGLEG